MNKGNTSRSPALVAVMAEFTHPHAVLEAARRVRDSGYRHWDVHSPFPIHGIDDAMGIRPTVLPWMVFAGGVLGAAAGLFLSWYTNAVDYPFLISGKPLFSLPANVPVIFETTILVAAFGAVFGMLGLNLLPRLSNPLFLKSRFRRATSDRFFLVIESRDPQFDRDEATRLLSKCDPVSLEEVVDE